MMNITKKTAVIGRSRVVVGTPPGKTACGIKGPFPPCFTIGTCERLDRAAEKV